MKRVLIVSHDEWSKLSVEIAAAPALGNAAYALSRGLARLVDRPLALLSHDGTGWHFEAGGVPDGLEPALRCVANFQPRPPACVISAMRPGNPEPELLSGASAAVIGADGAW